ncbi:MAG: CHAD domain-containing protein [Thermoanaerobaculaceae bacterium]|nr:CHAD domain-containing protein [Thermoanaerobaculaceae bacterium]
MEEAVKNIIKSKEEGIKIGFALKSELGRGLTIKKISPKKNSVKITFYDTPKFELFKNNAFAFCRKAGRRAFFYSISEKGKTPLLKDEKFFAEFFPFFEITAKAEKVKIYSKNIPYEAILYSDVVFSNPISEKEKNFNDFFECEFPKADEIFHPFFNLDSFFKERFWGEFRDLEIPYILNEEKLNLKIDENEAVFSALLKSIRKQTYKIQGFRYGVLKDLHPEYVHEMRVAFRKTRSYLNTFPEVLGPKRSRSISISASSFAFDLGVLRDLDVFLSHLSDFFKEIECRNKENEILKIFERLRKEETEIVHRVLNSSKFEKFLVRLFNFSQPKEKSNALAKKPFKESGFEKLSLLKSTIKKRMKKYKKIGSPDLLHRVRISFKKFRYLFEILEPFYGRAATKMKAKLSEIQDSLGFHQDMQIAQKLIEDAAEQTKDKDIILVLGALLQIIKRKEEKETKKFDKIYREFEKISIPSFIGGQNESGGSWSRKSRKRNRKRSSFRQKPES